MELSRSEQKRRMEQLANLVEELADLPPALLNQVPAGEEVQALLQEAAGLNKDGARKRQIKYITKLVREEESGEKLYAFLAERKGTELRKKKQLHEIEHMRDALIEEAIAVRRKAKEKQEEFTEDWPSAVAEEIAAELPSADKGELVRLACFFAVSRNPRHSREIFRLLRAAQEKSKALSAVLVSQPLWGGHQSVCSGQPIAGD